MLFSYQYKTDEEKNNLLSSNASLILIEQQNLFEGNFLVFSDAPLDIKTETVYTNIPENEWDDLKKQLESSQEAIDFLLMNNGGI